MAVVGEIKLSGFGSYGPEQTLTLAGQGPVAVIGDNGVGKSTAVSKGLTWCLYGKCPPERMGSGTRAITGRSVVGTKQKKAIVSVKIIEGETDSPLGQTVWTITRERARTGSDLLSVKRDGLEQDDATQMTIEAIIGADYDTFCRTVVRGQGDPWSFAEATDGRKREILDAISGAEELEGAWASAKQKRAEAEASADIAERRGRDLKDRLDRMNTKDTQDQLAQWAVDHKVKIKEAEAEIKAIKAKHRKAKIADKDIGDNRKKREKLRNQEPTLDNSPYQEAIDEAAKYYREAFAAYQTARRDVERLSELSLGDPCPTCEQPVGGIVVTKLGEAQGDEEALKNAATIAKSEEERCKDVKAAADDWLTTEHGNWQKDILEIPDRMVEAPALEREIRLAERRLLDLTSVVNPYQSRLEAEVKLEGELRREVCVADSAVLQSRWVAEAAAAWQEALGPKGARAHMAESALAAVESAANRWLSVLSDRGMAVEFPPTREVKGRIKEEIKTIVHIDDNGTDTVRDLLTFSGGERRRINLAVDLGVASACGGGGLSLSLLVLDEEVFSGMDESGKAAVVEALHNAGVADVVVIDHDPRLSSTLKRTVKVSRSAAGYSKLEEVTV